MNFDFCDPDKTAKTPRPVRFSEETGILRLTGLGWPGKTVTRQGTTRLFRELSKVFAETGLIR